jgi:pilus assembly protein CpaC
MKFLSSFRSRLAFCVLLGLTSLTLISAQASETKTASAASPKTSVPREIVLPLRVLVDQGLQVTLPSPASSVFIANPDIADIQVLSPTAIMVFGKKTGDTTLTASNAEGQMLIYRAVHVVQDLEALRTALDAVIPHNQIKVEAVPNGIVMTGTARDSSVIDDARRLALRYVAKDGEVINRIHVQGSNQIHIRVRFAEVSRTASKSLGFDWENIGNAGGFALGLAAGSSVITNIPGSGTTNAANLLNRNRPVTSQITNDVVSFSHKGSNYNINGMIDAMVEDGLVTILAEPNLTAMSGETASFLAGGEFPIPVPQAQQTITIEWKQYGVSLAFTPTLIGQDRINLHVRPEVSQLTTTGGITLDSITIPALTTRRAETTIELASGQSFAIGGLLDNNQSQTIDKYPFLGDIPVLGALFRSTNFQNNQTELVIIITPYIVHPTEQENLALPTDGFAPPSDIDQLVKFKSVNTSPDAHTMSGAPRAEVVQPEEAPVPMPSPVGDVTALPPSAPQTLPVSAPVLPPPSYAPAPPASLNTPAPLAPAPSAAPASSSGPGGFILE